MGWSKKFVHIRRLVGFTTLVSTAILYTASLYIPAVRFDTDPPTMSPGPGYGLLIIGWITMYLPIFFISWLANPALWAAFVAATLSRWRIALFCGIVATVFGLGIFLMYDPNAPVPKHRGNHMSMGPLPSRVTEFGPGYFCWIGSAVCLSLGACAVLLIDSRHDEIMLFELLEKPRPLIGKEDFGPHSDL